MNNILTRLAKVFLCLSAFFLFSHLGFAQEIPAKTNKLVNDFANILTDKQERALEEKLKTYSDSTSTQICVVTVSSLNGTTSNDFAQKLGEKWGVGTKENNGIVILVKPKTKDEMGDVSIQVGYGIEPYVTDAAAYLIRTKEMIPAFKLNDYYAGINNACDVIFGLLTGAFSAEEYTDDGDETLGYFAIILTFVFIFVMIWASKKSKNSNNGTGSSGGKKSGFWEGVFLGSMMSGGRRSGWGSSGGSWGGGHSSGGFGGFGGGHFGGGGGSSKW